MKLYIVVRNDISPEQKAVQAGHALAQWLLDNPNSVWTNGTLVYLTAKDKYQLEKIMLILDVNSTEFAMFREPDMDNEVTAIASLGTNSMFKKMPLLRY